MQVQVEPFSKNLAFVYFIAEELHLGYSKLSYSSVEGQAFMKVVSMSAVVTSWN